ncbi:hypothetical protein ACH4GK_22780 [Streptomyces rimosus]|uniref:hypothetical protein n=1 Tax=Streptomyces rimosus TaxID=1927 RepID=UPI0004C6AC63|nr:hypothetical protein [Streptomyces rimosus]
MTPLEPDASGQLILGDGCLDVFGLPGDPLDAAVARLRAGVQPTTEDIAMLTEAARTAQRAFAEIDAANAVLDSASSRSEDLVATLDDSLHRRVRTEIPPLLGALRVQAAHVERSEAIRTVANRILSDDEPDEPITLKPVPALTSGLLPRVPSVYDDAEEPVNDLADAGERQERLERVRQRVRRERVQRVAAHLITLAEEIVDRAFTDARFTRAVLDEMDRAYTLWCACLDEG